MSLGTLIKNRKKNYFKFRGFREFNTKKIKVNQVATIGNIDFQTVDLFKIWRYLQIF